MSRKTEEMKIKSIGKKVTYQKTDKTISSLCAVKAEDSNGEEHGAFAWGGLCDQLRIGAKVVATKGFSPNKGDNRLVIIKKA